MELDPKPRPSVLVVEDEPGLAGLYADWLRGSYHVRAVHNGEDALEELHDGIDVVLLDRHMPDIPGDEVLVAIRDRGLDCRVAMVTGVTPDFDILTMGFDDYVEKPLSRETLEETVDRLVEIDAYDALHIRLSSLRVRRNVIREEKSTAELAASERFQALQERIDELEAEVARMRQSVELDVTVASS